MSNLSKEQKRRTAAVLIYTTWNIYLERATSADL
ncbi:hypothetical protein HU200_042558 [Digitaria exilis]|uniref:Uncharacterized protein n=1 Tax=Digitaria exilis TaxID=1010633 RepID=A0A835ECL8_9POAL|nr:hypothetical protein HU200_042558 [Digitaria exilis]